MCGDIDHFVFHLAHRVNHRRTTHSRRATTKCTNTVLHSIGIAVDNANIVNINTQTIGNKLGKRGLLSLSVGRYTREHSHLARGIYTHSTAFPTTRGHRSRRAHPADLHIRGKSNTEVSSLFAQFCLLLAQSLVIRHLKRLVERSRIVATIISHSGSRFIRESVFANKVFAPHLQRIQIQIVRHHINHAFDEIRSFGTPRTSIGIRRHLIGKSGCEIHLHIFKCVRTAQHQSRQRGNGRREQLIISPHISRNRVFETENRAIVFDREFDIPGLIASVNRVQKVLTATFYPLDGLHEIFRHMPEQGFFGIHIEFATKATAHFGRDNAHMIFGHIEHNGYLRAQKMGNLRG